ncbi:MAG: DUF4397 domain-containing protein [Epulopiscium sp.]|jgi:hypothetical protein|nr:DUF4397 domain-containing protein [Candidatus Epulonipiscium sp.]
MRLYARQNGVETSADMIMPLPLTEEQISNLTNENYTTEINNMDAIRLYQNLGLPDGSNITVIPIIPGITRMAYIRFLNANPMIGPVDIYVNGRKVVSGLKYQAFTEYMKVFQGYYRIAVFKAGTTENPISVTRLNVIRNRIYTVAITGDAESVGSEVIVDGRRTLNPDLSYMRFIHLSDNAPSVDVYVDDRLVLSDLGFNEVSRYLSLLPGEHSIVFKKANTDDVILIDPVATLKAGKAYSVYFVGEEGMDPGLQVLIPLEGTTYLKF